MTKRRYLIVGEAIEKKLVDSGYKIGQKIPAERELCTEFNVSRSTLREAIVMLELKGVVEVKKGVGIFFVAKENQFTSEDEKMSEMKLKRAIKESKERVDEDFGKRNWKRGRKRR